MNVTDSINAADALLPGSPSPDGENDPRWQAIIAVSQHVDSEPEEVWRFVLRWGGNPQEDLRDAVATCLLEHLLDRHFDLVFPLVEEAALTDTLFADTFLRCWAFGQSQSSTNAARIEALKNRCKLRPETAST